MIRHPQCLLLTIFLSRMSTISGAAYLRTTPANLVRSRLQGSPVSFNSEWIHDFDIPAAIENGRHNDIPTHLQVPNFVPTYDLSYKESTSMQQLAQETKAYILQFTGNSTSSGAILFRGLDQVLHNVSGFEKFWSMMEWEPVQHISCYNRKRKSVGLVDMVDTDVPHMVLGPHNEHACNPHSTGRIAFYGLRPAQHGGESLIRRNVDIKVPKFVKEFVEVHGGIRTVRVYHDHFHMLQDTSRHPTSMSWQERCKTDSKQECHDFFAIHGMNGTTSFDENGTLTATSVHPGWHNGQWFNHVDYGFPTTCADGTEFPKSWQMSLKRQKWWETYAYKLQVGDWLVLDNKSIQHGRLPYQGERQLIVSYTN